MEILGMAEHQQQMNSYYWAINIISHGLLSALSLARKRRMGMRAKERRGCNTFLVHDE
jgi:hypothetical protein